MRPAACLIALLVLAGCGRQPETPEARVRAALSALEAAAEAGDVGAFRDLVSERYQDPYGHDKQGLTSFLALEVMRSGRGREVVMRVREVKLVSPTRAAVALHVGLAGAGGSRLRGEVYRVELDMGLEDGAWRLIWARWEPAPPSALL